MSDKKYYLAVDIGASSGRHILGCVEDGKIKYEEVYRFENGPVKRNGHMCWELDRLFSEIVNGMKACRDLGKIPVSMGIDTWGVDFVLLDKEDKVIGDTVCYRDERTAGVDSEVYKIIPEDELYARTGIQKQIFNTIYQLMAIKEKEPESLAKAESFLMVPDYFNFLLTGVKKQEYTNATTGQLVDPNTKQWDRQLIERLGLPAGIFKELSMPGTIVGRLSPEIQKKVGYDLDVILPGTHDTASAVLAVPMEKGDSVYISSGTWSLMGIEQSEADCSERARECNFTNEGGYEGRFRFLKNIMGLWMIQSVRHELDDKYSFAELCDMAEDSDIDSIVDANDGRFLAPLSMTEEVKKACAESGQKIPQTPGELAKVIYRSLAVCYRRAIEEIEDITGHTYPQINIVGGGANADYLNRLTAAETGKKVFAGPTEATALGNLGAQMIRGGEFASVPALRKCIAESFDLKAF